MRGLSVMRLARVVRSNVDRQLPSNGGNSETGAVAVLVATLLGGGVLLGLGAIVLDTGSLLYERRQLQNGADAGALSVGKDCATNASCDPLTGTAMTVLAGLNASDGVTAIESICGNSIAHTPKLPICGTSTGQLVDCPPVPSRFASAPYIEVRTKTLNVNGTNILPPILAQTLAGGAYSGETVRACSRAAWLPAGTPTGPVLPVAFSSCQWGVATGYTANGFATYQPPPTPNAKPGYGGTGTGLEAWPLHASDEVVLLTQTTGKIAPACNTWNGHVAPGTFGELSATGCGANVSTDNWVQGTNGNPAPCDLSTFNGLLGQVVNVPIFDCYTPNKFNWPWPDPPTAPTCNDTSPASWYHISGYGAFYLTGFNFSGGSYGNDLFPNGSYFGVGPCTGSDRCIAGWFTTGKLSATPSAGGTPNFGTYELQLAG